MAELSSTQTRRDALAREIAERRTGMPAYLVDNETWAAAEAEADDLLRRPPAPSEPLFDGRGCGHPPDPLAARYGDLWACHCGRILDPAGGVDIPEAPGPVVSCDQCGCGVAIPVKP